MSGSRLDVEVAALMTAGDRVGAAERVIRVLGPQIQRYLHGLALDPDDADDAFCRFAENVWSHIAALRQHRALRAWAYRVALNAGLRVLRDPYRRRHARLRTSEAAALPDEATPTPLSAAPEACVEQRLERLRRQLPPEDRALIMLRVDRRMSWREVASILAADGAAVDASALRKRFERLKRRIRALAVAEGLVAS